MSPATPPPAPVTGIRLSLWRAVVVFRVAALVVCLVLIVRWQPIYARPGVALAVAAGMVLVTAAVVALGWTGRAHRRRLVLADVLVTAVLTYASVAAQTDGQRGGGMVTLTTIWAAGPAIEAAFVAGPVAGGLAALAQYGVAFAVRGEYAGETLYSGIVLVIVGTVVGLVATYTVRAEDELRAASAARAALAERERLARSIHDGVLQVLGLVSRTGRDEGGQWRAIADAAAEQEAALRGLITSRPTEAGPADLVDALRALRSATVTVSAPDSDAALPAPAVRDLVDAVRAALQNVTLHAGDGAQAWVLLETLPGEVRVTVRDDGVGFAPGRLEDAARAGRIGVSRSVVGRVEHLGGRCTIRSAPGEGTEIEMTVPVA